MSLLLLGHYLSSQRIIVQSQCCNCSRAEMMFYCIKAEQRDFINHQRGRPELLHVNHETSDLTIRAPEVTNSFTTITLN